MFRSNHRKEQNKGPFQELRRLKVYGKVVSDVGCTRDNNEDNYLIDGRINTTSADYSEAIVLVGSKDQHWQIAGVFDGMGGGELGELASLETAVIFRDNQSRLMTSDSFDQIDQVIEELFQISNNRIVDMQRNCKIYGTTGTVVCFDGRYFKIYHMGDSRAYLLRDLDMFRLTQDHTLAQAMMEAGVYDETHPAFVLDRHKLTSYIGCDRSRKNIEIEESLWIPVESNDVLLICSDGLYDMCSEREIAQIMSDGLSVEQVANALVARAKAHGGEDNITCLILLFY